MESFFIFQKDVSGGTFPEHLMPRLFTPRMIASCPRIVTRPSCFLSIRFFCRIGRSIRFVTNIRRERAMNLYIISLKKSRKRSLKLCQLWEKISLISCCRCHEARSFFISSRSLGSPFFSVRNAPGKPGAAALLWHTYCAASPLYRSPPATEG